MKTVYLTINCQAVYNSSLQVPDDFTEEEAIEYAKQHLDEAPLGVLEYIQDSDVLDEENSGFDEEEEY